MLAEISQKFIGRPLSAKPTGHCPRHALRRWPRSKTDPFCGGGLTLAEEVPLRSAVHILAPSNSEREFRAAARGSCSDSALILILGCYFFERELFFEICLPSKAA